MSSPSPLVSFGLLALLGPTTARAASEMWRGRLTYPGCTDNVPLDLKIDTVSNVASANWTFQNCDGGHCGQGSAGGPITIGGAGRAANNWTAQGGWGPTAGPGSHPGAFYSLTGLLSEDKTQLTGGMVYRGGPSERWTSDGTWHATKNAPPDLNFTCVPPPPLPWAACESLPKDWTPPPPRSTTRPLLWPLPRSYTNGIATLRVHPGTRAAGFFSLIDAGSASKLLNAAFERYAGLTFPHAVDASNGGSGNLGDAGQISSLAVSVASHAEDYPQLGDNESYSLRIPVVANGTATLTAPTVFGALRGLETFSQLVRFDFVRGVYTLRHAPWLIEDEPRFPHRGLMVDTARHFQPVAALKAIVDSLTYAKLNVLHWHMSDTQSFPFESKSHPHLWDGAFSPEERYSQLDARELVEYARVRGVRVIVEFDVPGHAGSWCHGYPELCPNATCLQPLNPANNATFIVIEDLLHECTGGVASAPGAPSPGVFPDNFVHLGGDEVDTSCWQTTPPVSNWLKTMNMTADAAYAYFVKRVSEIAIKQGHRPVQWSEVYDHFKNSLPKETVIHIWKSMTNVSAPLAGGYNVLLNVGYNGLSWYLDNTATDWAHVYLNEPCCGVADDLCPMILGGHGEMWGETVDASDLQQTVWPRLAAVAERLWSPRFLNDTADAHDRIRSFRCLLTRRGVAAAPVDNPMARMAPTGPGSCLDQ